MRRQISRAFTGFQFGCQKFGGGTRVRQSALFGAERNLIGRECGIVSSHLLDDLQAAHTTHGGLDKHTTRLEYSIDDADDDDDDDVRATIRDLGMITVEAGVGTRAQRRGSTIRRKGRAASFLPSDRKQAPIKQEGFVSSAFLDDLKRRWIWRCWKAEMAKFRLCRLSACFSDPSLHSEGTDKKDAMLR